MQPTQKKAFTRVARALGKARFAEVAALGLTSAQLSKLAGQMRSGTQVCTSARSLALLLHAAQMLDIDTESGRRQRRPRTHMQAAPHENQCALFDDFAAGL
jgi:hypothetical protein